MSLIVLDFGGRRGNDLAFGGRAQLQTNQRVLAPQKKPLV
jgi:hypothetical protein